jgi:hypothetical protein
VVRRDWNFAKSGKLAAIFQEQSGDAPGRKAVAIPVGEQLNLLQ